MGSAQPPNFFEFGGMGLWCLVWVCSRKVGVVWGSLRAITQQHLRIKHSYCAADPGLGVSTTYTALRRHIRTCERHEHTATYQ